MLQALIPQSTSGRLLLVVSILASAAVYLFRFALYDLIPSIVAGLLCVTSGCILPLLASLLAVGYFGVTLAYGFKAGGHPMPTIVLIVGVILALSLPLPPPYEIRLFKSHQTEYEQLVTLAQNHQLSHGQWCEVDPEFKTPAEYKKLSGECILVDYEPFFSIRFRPRSYTDQIVYIEDPNQIDDVWGCNSLDDNEHNKPIGLNWFYCLDTR
jgi:hypothetical protein